MIPSSSFSLLTTNEEISFNLSSLYKALRPGGRFLFEVETPLNCEEYQNIWAVSSVDKSDGSKIVLSTSTHFNPTTQIQSTLCRYELWQCNQVIATEVEDFRLRLHNPIEIEIMLKEAGFKLIKRRTPYVQETPNDLLPIILYEYEKEI